MKKIITLIILLVSDLVFGHDVELRFIENRVEGDFLFLDIDIRAINYSFNLASHNIVAYYDHASLELVDVTSRLPESTYSKPKIDEMSTDILGVSIGDLPFEDNMGFINMSVHLQDNHLGGIDISSDWITIHTAIFQVVDDHKCPMIVWANELTTAAYATAFVEVAEWSHKDVITVKRLHQLSNYDCQNVDKENNE